MRYRMISGPRRGVRRWMMSLVVVVGVLATVLVSAPPAHASTSQRLYGGCLYQMSATVSPTDLYAATASMQRLECRLEWTGSSGVIVGGSSRVRIFCDGVIEKQGIGVNTSVSTSMRGNKYCYSTYEAFDTSLNQFVGLDSYVYPIP